MESLTPIRFGSVSMVTATLGGNDPTPGDRTVYGDEKYVFVYNAGNSQISPGYGAVLSAVTGYSVTVSSTTNADFFVGFCKHATLTTGTYGWLVTQGFCQVTTTANDSCVTGQMLTLGVDGTVALKSQSTGYLTPVIGKAMASIASGSSGTAYISLF